MATLTGSPTVTATTTHKVALKPTVKRRLLQELKAFAELKGQLKAIEHAMEGHKGAIAAIREETGETTLELEGFKITYVTPTRSSLDKGLLLAQGVSMAQIEQATTVVPTKPYVKVSLPGEVEKDYGR